MLKRKETLICSAVVLENIESKNGGQNISCQYKSVIYNTTGQTRRCRVKDMSLSKTSAVTFSAE